MWRSLAKAALLTAFGRVPGGPSAYRTITREWMGTQAMHPGKLARAWPGYVAAWRDAGLELEGAGVWIFEGGWTPFPFLADQLVTGGAGVVTNRDAVVLDRYVVPAVNAAVGMHMPGIVELERRRRALGSLRWASARAGIDAIGGRLVEHLDVSSIPLEDASVDLAHSGGALEHLTVAELRAFLAESQRIVRPGGLVSHVVDHRDHLHHADRGWPFLGHLALGERTYRALFGHPLAFHDRLPPEAFAALFEAAGFEHVAIRRLILPSRRWVDSEAEALTGRPGLERRRLAPAFRGMSEADLRTAAAHYLYRRPRG